MNIAGSANAGVDLIAGHHELGRGGAVIAGVDLIAGHHQLGRGGA